MELGLTGNPFAFTPIGSFFRAWRGNERKPGVAVYKCLVQLYKAETAERSNPLEVLGPLLQTAIKLDIPNNV